MTVADLIAELENLDPNALVLVAHQPSWPLQERVVNVVEINTTEDEIDELSEAIANGAIAPEDLEDAKAELERLEDTNQSVVYIAADGLPWGLSPYAPREVFNR